MRVKVTQKHISEGKKSDCFLCPIALAVMEMEPKPTNVDVKYTLVEIFHGEQSKQYWLPLSARNFVRSFDYGFKVEPFEFDLNQGVVDAR